MLFYQRGNSKLSINLNLTSTIANHSPAPQKEGAGTLVFIQNKCWPEQKNVSCCRLLTLLSVFANWQGIYPGMHYCKCKPSPTHVLGHAFHSSLFHPSLWTSWSFCTWKLTEEDANHQMHRGLICQGPWTSNPWLLGVANCGSEKKNNVSTWNPLLWNHQNTWDLWIWITPNDSISLVLTPGEWLTSPGSIEWCQFSDVSHYPSQPCQPGCIPIGSSHWVPKILSLFMVQKSKSKKTV
jgi:hypothetical protein